jgi:hypothetical protein
MLYEERRVRLVCEGDWAPYRSWALHTLWSDLQRHGHKVVCVLNGLIGKGVQDVLIIVGYDDFAARQAAQPLFMGQRERVLDEEIHLLESSPYTEGRGVNVEDRRNIYGVRRWWIDPKDWDEFVGLSYEGIWPAMDYVRAIPHATHRFLVACVGCSCITVTCTMIVDGALRLGLFLPVRHLQHRAVGVCQPCGLR